MKIQDAIDCLRLFNFKCNELLESNFVKELKKGQRGFIISWDKDKGWDSVYIGPENESTRAFILTLRLFLQQGDRISFEKIKGLYGNFPALKNLKEDVFKITDTLEFELNQSTRIAIEEGKTLSFKELFNYFVYGNFAHVNKEKHDAFRDFSGTPFYPGFQTNFVDVCQGCLMAIAALSKVNQKAIPILEKELERKGKN